MFLRPLVRFVNKNVYRKGNSVVLGKPCISPVFVRCIGLDHSEAATAGTMGRVHDKIMTRLGLEHGYMPKPKSREHFLEHAPKLEDLPPRSMQDSFTSAIILLLEDKELQDKYLAFLGNVRLGRLMEDMDLFAVLVCHQHVMMPNLPQDIHLPYTFVTILVDKVEFADLRAKATADMRLSGHVSWVGKSYMEIVVWLERLDNGNYKKITRALFMMAARNATNTGSAPVNPIKPANEYEQKILACGEELCHSYQSLKFL